MELRGDTLKRWILTSRKRGRFTQDSPVMPDVWLEFTDPDAKRVDVLLTPEDENPAPLAAELRERLSARRDSEMGEVGLAYSGSYVVATLTFEELLDSVMPLSAWWGRLDRVWARSRSAGRDRRRLAGDDLDEVEWLALAIGAVQELRESRGKRGERGGVEVSEEALVARGWLELEQRHAAASPARPPVLRRVTLNRQIEQSVTDSRKTVKADAAIRVFDLDCAGIAWAVIDSGIDARHPAFRRRDTAGKPYGKWYGPGPVQRTRIAATYDMTRLRSAQRLLQGDGQAALADPAIARLANEQPGIVGDLREHLKDRRPLDWALLEPLLRVPQTKNEYEEPHGDHGTHVAGILAADWPAAGDHDAKGPLAGLCPRLELFDLRVFDDDGHGDEFALSAALQFIDHLNGYGRRMRIAGANVSLSLRHDLSFGCGQTPVCQEANRLVAGGVVVVAAAGNRGSEQYPVDNDFEQTIVDGFRMVSLTDPGNAEDVITVGSTHAINPHAYGISYFSSRGPTGDGRNKPDLVAPGEKIEGPAVGGGRRLMDGTSQAAPHVSGAAALLLARHRELIGKPLRVKELLMRSATDLGREPYFQGAGLVDVLRTTQAV